MKNDIGMINLVKKFRKATGEELNGPNKEKILERYIRQIEQNFISREKYLKYLHQVESSVKYIQKRELKLITDEQTRQARIDDISQRVMKGLGNDV